MEFSEYFSYVNMVSIERIGHIQTTYERVLEFYNWQIALFWITHDRLYMCVCVCVFERHLTLSQFWKYVTSGMFRWWGFKNS